MCNDNGSLHQAMPIDPFNITNLFLNYTVRGLVEAVAVAHPAGGQQPDRQPRDHRRQPGIDEVERRGSGDVLTLMSGRSVSVAFTVGLQGRAALSDDARNEPRTHAQTAERIVALRAVRSRRFLLRRARGAASTIQFVFTSDAHYGLAHAAFRGAIECQRARCVNRRAGGGDQPRRRRSTSSSRAATSPTARKRPGRPDSERRRLVVSVCADYFDGLTVNDADGRRAAALVVPGNHEASNAVGFYKPMTPPIDKTSMVEIYNRMMLPAAPKTAASYTTPATACCIRTRRRPALRFIRSGRTRPSRRWLEHDLARVDRSTPVVLFVHDQPEAHAKHFTNPNAPHDINATDKFENLLADTSPTDRRSSRRRSPSSATSSVPRTHRNITAYFHGNSNWNEFYEWTGPSQTLGLHMFRVDSPMKGQCPRTTRRAVVPRRDHRHGDSAADRA